MIELRKAANVLHKAAKIGRRFQNPEPTQVAGLRLLSKILPLYLRNRAETEPRHPLGPFRTDPALYATPPRTGLRVTWFGHSASLVEIDGARILIDPVYERASPLPFAGPQRFFAPTIALNDLPPIDAVLISHDHYDHFGSTTIRTLAQIPAFAQTQWITSLGVGTRLLKRGVARALITELDWTESATVRTKSAPIKITAWPARHFSGRGLFDRFTTLWSSFVLEGPAHRVYFGADSGAWQGIAAVAARYPHFDLTMLEVGAFHPLWASIHLGPQAAVETFAAMNQAMGHPANAGLLMPIHWGLFNLALHGWREPIEQTVHCAAAAGTPLFSPRPGAPTDVDGPILNEWWRNA